MNVNNRSACALAVVVCLLPAVLSAEPVAVRHAEGLTHGFLLLRSPDGALLANGDLIQNLVGGRVSSRLVFRFKDGSVSDETSVFSQRGHFSCSRTAWSSAGRPSNSRWR